MVPFTRSKVTGGARAPPEGVACFQHDTFMRMDDIVFHTLTFLSLVHLLKYASLSKSCGAEVTSLLQGRVYRYTRPFFPFHAQNTPHRLFFHALRTTQSWIVGSVPLGVLSVLGDPPCPSNLNVITSYIWLDYWLRVMVHDLGYSIIHHGRCPGALAADGGRFVKFHHPKVAQPTVGAMDCRVHSYRTPSILRPLKRYHPSRVWSGSTRVPERGAGHVETLRWRFTNGLQRIGHWKWGGVDEVDPVLRRLSATNIRWRSGELCFNATTRLIAASAANSDRGPDRSYIQISQRVEAARRKVSLDRSAENINGLKVCVKQTPPTPVTSCHGHPHREKWAAKIKS
ncbi:hypothetical protein B0H10DRAFT_2198527 [Mycena sp. CBHHK59/15]|nr:hypothetical protein B0H10DRAFT_2198527 [Mycena sp. CBHHK59/15]